MPGKKYCQTVIMDRRPILFGLGIVTAGIIAGCFLQYRPEESVLDACFNHKDDPEKVLKARQILTQLDRKSVV